ncbi:MAG: adenine deaminase [Taibaiella sp.]|nr:adenine deaminase [Taibaiella sp.]
MYSLEITGQYVDLFHKRIFPARIVVSDGIIIEVQQIDGAPQQYLLPGFIDAHVHIESAMLTPAAFGRIAVTHGTVATISDPHEIANVCGAEGVQYMIENSRHTPLKIFFGAPSCVPATIFENAGATLDVEAVAKLLRSEDIWYLSEMMNYPGVLNRDTDVIAKIDAARNAGKPVDGHAPGLKGELAKVYATAGITTDHECYMLDEAIDKINCGMHILIREGSAAKNYEALASLLRTHPHKVMFCSDDKHPDELVLGHINRVVKRALNDGYDVYDVLRAACINPAIHYKIPVGLLRIGDPADFIVLSDLQQPEVLQTYIKGQLVAERGKPLLPVTSPAVINNFIAKEKQPDNFAIHTDLTDPVIRVIEAIEGQLITNELQLPGKAVNGQLVSDVANDILKIVVVNRYEEYATPAVAFIKNFGLQRGAIASTVAHDCHNIIAVGTDDDSICAAVNSLIACKGGIAVAENADNVTTMPLPIGGIMSDKDAYETAAQYSLLDNKAKALGTPLKAPFMTLSFMALLVIPSLKLSDKGLFDGSRFSFTDVIV